MYFRSLKVLCDEEKYNFVVSSEQKFGRNIRFKLLLKILHYSDCENNL